MRRRSHVLITITVSAVLAVPVFSHHSMATYDQTALIPIKGIVSRVEWLNPHVWVTVTVTSANGTTFDQRIEIAAPQSLVMRGLEKRTLQAGDAVTIDTWMPKDPGFNLPPNGRALTLTDGRRFDVGDNWPSRPDRKEPR